MHTRTSGRAAIRRTSPTKDGLIPETKGSLHEPSDSPGQVNWCNGSTFGPLRPLAAPCGTFAEVAAEVRFRSPEPAWPRQAGFSPRYSSCTRWLWFRRTVSSVSRAISNEAASSGTSEQCSCTTSYMNLNASRG